MQGAVVFTDCQDHGMSNPLISNCVFTGNIGSSEMIYDNAAEAGISNLSIVNCTFYNNTPYNLITPYGYNGNLLVSITNCIIQRGSQGIYDESESTVYDINHTTSQYGYEGNNNTASSEYSYFTNPSNPIGADGIWRTADDGLTLKSCATAINSGNNSMASITDITGHTRIVNTVIDRGAYEGLANVIILSSQAVNNQSFIQDGCTGNTWTYYAIPGQPGKLSFAISWGAANTAARNSATINVNTDNANTVQTTASKGIAAMLRYWNVDLHGVRLNAPVSVRFYYDETDIYNMKTSLNDIGPVSEVTWISNIGNPYSPSQVTTDNINNGNYSVLVPAVEGVQDGISFVEFAGINVLTGGTATVTAAADILPVTLNSFTVTPKDCQMLLTWKVSGAVNFKQYELQRSENGTNFITLATVAHNNEQSLYRYTDATLSSSGNYLYRLKLVDIDGNYKVSVIQAARYNCETGKNSMIVFPNPVIAACTVQLATNMRNVSVTLYNIYGRPLYSTIINGSVTTVTIPMQHLPSGIYTILVKGNQGVMMSGKIVKE